MSQSRKRTKLQASLGVSSPAQREGPALLDTGKLGCFAAFTCLFACSRLHVPVPLAGRRRAQGTCTWPAPRCVINTSSGVACQPWLKPWAPLGMLAGTKPRPYLLLWLLLTPAFLFSSLLFSYLLSSLAFLSLSEHWLFVSSLFSLLFKSILNISPDTFCCRPLQSSISISKRQVNSLLYLTPPSV